MSSHKTFKQEGSLPSQRTAEHNMSSIELADGTKADAIQTHNKK